MSNQKKTPAIFDDSHEEIDGNTVLKNPLKEVPMKSKNVVDSKIKKTALLTSIIFCVFFSMFPNAGLGPVLGTVANDLNDSKNMSWYMTVFSLSSTICQLLGVRISECLGRRRSLLASTIFTLVTTLICGCSIDSKMLIACRLLQGCAVGNCVTIVAAALIDLFDMKDRLKYQPLVNMSFGICFILGPILGSVFADHLSWRYIFWLTAIVFVPINIAFYYLIDIPIKPDQTLSKENLKTLIKRIDPIGCFLITVGLALFLLGMHLGSTSTVYTWSSPVVIGFLAGFCLFIILFLIFEKCITPLPLFPSVVVLDIHLMMCYIQQFVVGWQFIYFDILLFIQYQAVDNLSPTNASIKLLPPAIVHVFATIIGGRIAHKFENPKGITIVGNVLNTISSILIVSVQNIDSSIAVQMILLSIYEIGMGITTTCSALCNQIIVEKKAPHLVPVSNSLSRCFNRCGSTIATAFVISMLQSQTASSINELRLRQPEIYQYVSAADATYNYAKIKDVTSGSAIKVLNNMYFGNIKNIVYGFMAWNIISLLCSIFTKIPSISEKHLSKTSENK